MLKNKKLIIILIILSICIGIFAYYMNLNSKMKLTPEKREKIISIVNTYYDNMSNKNYEDALKLIDLEKTDYDKNLVALKNSNYNIAKLEHTNYWMIPVNGRYDYISVDKSEKCFIVSVAFSSKYNDLTYSMSEGVYIRQFDNEFKIVKIYSGDRYSSIKRSYIQH